MIINKVVFAGHHTFQTLLRQVWHSIWRIMNSYFRMFMFEIVEHTFDVELWWQIKSIWSILPWIVTNRRSESHVIPQILLQCYSVYDVAHVNLFCWEYFGWNFPSSLPTQIIWSEVIPIIERKNRLQTVKLSQLAEDKVYTLANLCTHYTPSSRILHGLLSFHPK